MYSNARSLTDFGRNRIRYDTFVVCGERDGTTTQLGIIIIITS